MKETDSGRNNTDLPSDISPEIVTEVIDTFFSLRQKHKLSEKQIFQILKEGHGLHIPTSIFSNTELSGLELACIYLKDKLNVPFSKISKLINRDYRTIWASYRAAKRKLKGRLIVPSPKYFFPITVLADRNLSVLEAIVSFMKNELGLKLVDIACELHRDQRNIWTVYRRANAKNK
jgi:hypothetical protein